MLRPIDSLAAFTLGIHIVFVPACGGGFPSRDQGSGQTDTESGQTDTESGQTTQSDLPDGCACNDEGGGNSMDDLFECPGEALCAPILWECPRPAPDMYACTKEYRYDEEALTCALEALRDRKPGFFVASGENSECGLEGCGRDSYLVHITSDEEVVRQSCSANPLQRWGLGSCHVNVGSIEEPDYFEACIGLNAGPPRFSCMLAGLNGGPPTCE